MVQDVLMIMMLVDPYVSSWVAKFVVAVVAGRFGACYKALAGICLET